MLTEYPQGTPVRTFSYDGAGRMVEATVFTLTTRFRYNGLGARVVVEVVGHGTTTYTLDYAAGNCVLAEVTGDGTVHYLYGRDCLGEFRDNDWLYYLNDATGYLRQGADAAGEVISSWLFNPDGVVLEGLEGPVSHLVCGGMYDWSTGLIHKDGRYFDPMLGIWLALMPLIVVQLWRGKEKKRRKLPWYSVVLLAVCMSGVLTACGGEEIDWETIDENVCIEVPTTESRGSQTVNIHHVSGPDATVYGEYKWRVRFELEDEAASTGWFIQEIDVTMRINFTDGAMADDSVFYYEAWPVEQGSKSSSKVRGSPWARYNDVYMLKWKDPQIVIDSKVMAHGTIKFYEGILPAGFEVGKVNEAGTWLHSSYDQPPFWDGCGTAHDLEIEWNGTSADGYVRRGNQEHRFAVP